MGQWSATVFFPKFERFTSRRSAFRSPFCFDDESVELQKFDIVTQVETYVNKLVFGFRFFDHGSNMTLYVALLVLWKQRTDMHSETHLSNVQNI